MVEQQPGAGPESGTSPQGPGAEAPAAATDVTREWDSLEAGQKSRAMRFLHEEQQKMVVEIGRQIMEMEVEIAIALTRARALYDMNRAERSAEIVEQEVQPRRRQLQELRKRYVEERDLLETYEKLGKGLI